VYTHTNTQLSPTKFVLCIKKTNRVGFRVLAIRLHPDKESHPQAAEAFVKMRAAHDRLMASKYPSCCLNTGLRRQGAEFLHPRARATHTGGLPCTPPELFGES